MRIKALLNFSILADNYELYLAINLQKNISLYKFNLFNIEYSLIFDQQNIDYKI